MVNELRHTDVDQGFKYWDLRNMNNQEIAPGLYFYTIVILHLEKDYERWKVFYLINFSFNL